MASTPVVLFPTCDSPPNRSVLGVPTDSVPAGASPKLESPLAWALPNDSEPEGPPKDWEPG